MQCNHALILLKTFKALYLLTYFTVAQVGVQCIVNDQRVCLSLCLSICIHISQKQYVEIC